MRGKKIFCVLSLTSLFLIFIPLAQARHHFVTLGTGGIQGVYYAVGRAIAQTVNKTSPENGTRVDYESTPGSVFNLKAVSAGLNALGIVQSDVLYRAVTGTGEWKNRGAQENIRTVMTLFPEMIAVVAAVDTGISNITDLKGKRVNIGRPGSGYRQNAIDVLKASGLDYRSDIIAVSVVASKAIGMLENGSIDAFFYTGGTPNRILEKVTSGSRKVRFLPIIINKTTLQQHPQYRTVRIPVRRYYPGALNNGEVDTLGVQAVLITSKSVPDDIVYAITRSIFDNVEEFKQKHPAVAMMNKQLLMEGSAAPFHAGAIQYFTKSGLR